MEEQHSEWKLPAPSWVKLNFDGSIGTGSEEAGAGFVIRSEIGQPILAGAVHLQTKDVNVVGNHVGSGKDCVGSKQIWQSKKFALKVTPSMW